MKTIIAAILLIALCISFERSHLPVMTDAMYTEANQYGTTHDKETPPLPFVYDGCTLFPDTLLSIDLAHACYIHDIAYWYGGTDEERKAADTLLKEAAAAQGIFGQIMQYPVYMGVQLFGTSFIARAFNAHWGFGWGK